MSAYLLCPSIYGQFLALLCVCRQSIVHEPVHCKKTWAAVGELAYLGQSGVNQGSVIDLQTEGNLIFLPDAGDPGWSVLELHFVA